MLALDGPLDPDHAPVPSTFAERVAFGQLYHTLVQVDCEGRVEPGLAAKWRREDGGRRWVFQLRADATFADGIPLTAAVAAASWRWDARRRPRPWADAAHGSVVLRGDRELAVRLDRPHRTVPLAFAHQGLAIARPRPDGSPWPLGTGSYVVTDASPNRVVAVPRGVMERDALPTLVIRAAGRDPRDVVDAGFDILVTRNPAVSTYAIAAETARMVPLQWDRAYVLVLPAHSGAFSAVRTIRVSEDFTGAAMAADARTPGGAPWWDHAECAAATAAASSREDRAARVVYPRDDRTARGLAERVVALARSGRLDDVLPGGRDDRRPSAVGIDAAGYAAALAVGADLAYVLVLDRSVLDACVAVASLRAAAPWPAWLVPLVETRAHLVIRRLSGAIAIDWSGRPYLVPAGREP